MAVTIADVASAAGVSRSTVSRALSMPDTVNAATRTRVLEVARRLGYAPSSAARALAMGRTRVIGLIVPDIANPFFPPIIKGVQRRVRRYEYAVFIADTDERPADEADLVRAMSKQVDGIILVSSRMTDDLLHEFAADRPLVLVNRQVSGIPAILLDNADGTAQAVEHLHALGHQRMCFLAGPRQSWSSSARASAVRDACKQHDIELTEHGPFEAQFEAGIRAGDLVVASDVTGAIAYDDVLALGVISRLSERGIRVGTDISVVGFDDSPMARMSVPTLTTVRVTGTEAGIAAVDMILGILDGGSSPASDAVQLDTHLIVRASTGPAPVNRAPELQVDQAAPV